jgi:transcriptional regulator with XRE-family HTH domain
MGEERIGRCIKMAMIKADLDVIQLSERLGVTHQTVYSYMKGKGITIKKLGEIADALDIDQTELMSLAD